MLLTQLKSIWRKLMILIQNKNEALSQNFTDMKEYFRLTKIRVDKIEDYKNENEDVIINKFRSKIQASVC